MDAIQFTKMEGIGNDYLIVEDWNSQIKDPSALSKFTLKLFCQYLFIQRDITPPLWSRERRSHLNMFSFRINRREEEIQDEDV